MLRRMISCTYQIAGKLSALSFIIVFIVLCSFQATAQSGNNNYNILDYGATGDKSDLVTDTIQAAVDDAYAAGGGHVYFPPGNHLSGTIELKSNVTLYLESGATLWASRNAEDFREISYTTTHDQIPVLIYAQGAENIAIRGKGRLHGQAERELRQDTNPGSNFNGEEIQNAIDSGVDMKRYYKVPPFVTLVLFTKSKQITVEDVTLEESSFWTLHLHRSETIFIRGIQLYSSMESGVNADGIGIDSSRDVVISDVIIETGDDAIVFKTTYDPEGESPLENITVTNCIVSSTSAGLKIGTETYSDIRNVHFDNCVVRNSNRALNIVVRDGATVQDVSFSNITIETNRKDWFWWGNGDPIWLVLLKRNEDSKLGAIKDVVFDNIIARGQGTSKIEGYRPTEEYPEGKHLKNISLRNVRLYMEAEDRIDKRATHAFEAHHVKNLHLENMLIDWGTNETEPMWQSAMNLFNVNNLRLRGFNGRQGLLESDDPVIRMHNIQNATIEDLEAFEGSNILLNISGERTGNIVLDNINRMNQAPQGTSLGSDLNNDAVQHNE